MSTTHQSGDVEIRVRYAEVDRMGVLHHSRYWVYFELGRTELLRQNGTSYQDIEEAGVFLVVARCAAKYRAPARYDDELILTTRTVKMGRSRIDHAYLLTRKADGREIATAETTLACVDSQGRLVPVPDVVRGC